MTQQRARTDLAIDVRWLHDVRVPAADYDHRIGRPSAKPSRRCLKTQSTTTARMARLRDWVRRGCLKGETAPKGRKTGAFQLQITGLPLLYRVCHDESTSPARSPVFACGTAPTCQVGKGMV